MESFCHYNTFILVCSVHATPTLCLTLNVWHEARLLFETTEWALKALRGTSDCLDARILTSSGIRSVKWGLLWELKGKKKTKQKLRREKERERGRERYHSGRCCALSLSLISKFTDLATVNNYLRSVGDCQNDVETEADFLFRVWHVACVHVYVLGGIRVPKYCRFCGVGISNVMPAGRHVSMKGVCLRTAGVRRCTDCEVQCDL